MLPQFTPHSLSEATKKEELILKTAQQIIKDFAEFGLEITFSGSTENFYDELFVQMHREVESMLNNDYNKFLTMLYRIDISNKDVELYRTEMRGNTQPEIITTLIIHRELKKVMTREYFKNHHP